MNLVIFLLILYGLEWPGRESQIRLGKDHITIGVEKFFAFCAAIYTFLKLGIAAVFCRKLK